MKDWNNYHLGDLLLFISKGTTPPKGVGFVDEGINYIKSESISYNRKIDKSKFCFITPELHNKYKRSQLQEDDILFSMAGVFLGKNAVVKKNMLPANTNQALAILRVKRKLVLPDFLSYYLSQPRIIEYVNNMSGQSAQPNVNFEEIKSIPISIPELSEQHAVLNVLNTLDDKIDLLHRQNATLEAMAETSFRQSFEITSENKTKLGELLDISSGKGLKKEAFLENGAYPVLGANGKIGTTNQFLYDGKMIYTGRVGTLGNIYIFNGKAWYSDNTLLFTNTKYFYTVYFLLKFLHLEDYNVGSTQPLIRQSDIKSIDIFLPDKDIIEKFESNAETIFTKIRSNQVQIQTLEKLRDTLLPKLMSGEVRLALD